MRHNTDFTVFDPLSGGQWHTGSVREGNFEYNVNYNVREVDINLGELRTVIEARGVPTAPEAQELVIHSDTVRDPTVARSSHLYLTMNADPTSSVYRGDPIDYSFRVLNNGNITINNILLVEDHSGRNWSVPTLAPGEYSDFVYSYEVTQADFDTSSIISTLRANGTSAYGANPSEASVNTTVTTDYPDPRLSITKIADPTSDVTTGDVIDYRVTVTNTGDVSVSDGVLVDDHVDLSAHSFNLAPGEVAEFDYSYTVTQADMMLVK